MEEAWEDWLHFFLCGVIDTTEQATRTAQRILELFGADRQKVAGESLRHLERLGIVHETTGRKRTRVFVYGAYMKNLEEGTEPIR